MRVSSFFASLECPNELEFSFFGFTFCCFKPHTTRPSLVCNLISKVSNQCQHSFVIFFVLIQANNQQCIKSKPQTQTNCLHFKYIYIFRLLDSSRESSSSKKASRRNCIRKKNKERKIFNKSRFQSIFKWEKRTNEINGVHTRHNSISQPRNFHFLRCEL